ncbi:small membrane protein [Klebsiella sp. B345]
MVLQTWLVLLLCIFLLGISVYSLISYLKDRKKQKIPFFYKNNRKR